MQNETIDGHINNENITPPLKPQEKTTYGRLRVLTAPPTSVHELATVATSETASPRDNDVTPFSFDVQKNIDNTNRRIVTGGGGGGGCNTSGGTGSIGGSRRSNLRPSSGSSQRIGSSIGGGGGGGSAGGGISSIGSGGVNRDHSVTQFALIDDENVSALQQVTRGGGALTLASQWKSQFDDSEETTDNEWKQEPQSPDHHHRGGGGDNKSNITSQSHHHSKGSALVNKKKEAKKKKYVISIDLYVL